MKEYVILICVGLMLAVLFFGTVYPVNCEDCLKVHDEIVDQTAGSPYRYRQLVPALVDAFAQTITDQDRDKVNALAYSAAHAVIMPVMLISLYTWLTMVARQFALPGALLLAIYVPLAYTEYPSYALWSMVEVILVSVGLIVLWSTLRYRTLMFALLMMLAVLNRETGIFMSLLYLACEVGRGRSWLPGALMVVLGVGLYGALRLSLGDAAHVVTLEYLAEINQRFALRGLVTNLLMVPVPLVVVAGWRRADRRLRRMALVSLVYVALVLIWGQWHEVRLWLPLFPIYLAFWQE